MYKDRLDAGNQLAKELAYLKGESVVVLGIPRGGVVVAQPIAEALTAPLSVLIVRKIGAPGQEELALGAVGPDEKPVWNDSLLKKIQPDPEYLEKMAHQKAQEVQVRKKAFGADRMPVLKGKTVVVVDDGIATGATLKAGLMWLKKQVPAKVVVTVGCAPTDTADAIQREVDEFVCPNVSPNFYAVGQFYEDFREITTEEVRRILGKNR